MPAHRSSWRPVAPADERRSADAPTPPAVAPSAWLVARIGLYGFPTVAVLIGMLVLVAAAVPRAPTATVMFTARSGSQQGIATDGHYTWISYDDGGGMASIATYTRNGAYIGTSADLPIGHGAEIDYRVKDGRLYVANGGLATESTSADAKVYVVALNAEHVATKVSKTYDFGWLGRNGMVAIDNQTDDLLVMGGPDGGPWRVAITPFPLAAKTTASSMSQIVQIRDPRVLLQGLGAYEGHLYVYVSDQVAGGSRLDIFTTTGIRLADEVLPVTGEAEGLAVDPTSGSISLGTHSPNRVLQLGSGVRTGFP